MPGPTNLRRLPLLDGLRALAVMGVLLIHGGISAEIAGDAVIGPVLRRLDVVVPIFFAISGCVIYLPFLRANLARAPGPAASTFAKRRFFRIAPAYWVALTLVVLAVGPRSVFEPLNIPRYYLFLQTYSAETVAGGLPQAWTLCVEAVFYVLVPPWAWFMATCARRTGATPVRTELLGLASLMVVSIAFQLFAVRTGTVNGHIPALTPLLASFPTHIAAFAIGMGIALLIAGGAVEPVDWVERHAAALALAGIGVCVLLSAEVEHLGLDATGFTPIQYAVREAAHLIGAGLLVLAVACARPSDGFLGRLLGSRPLVFLGTVSFGIYLYHLGVLGLLGETGLLPTGTLWSLVLWMACLLVGAIGLGALSWYLIERPGIRYSKRRRRGSVVGRAGGRADQQPE